MAYNFTSKHLPACGGVSHRTLWVVWNFNRVLITYLQLRKAQDDIIEIQTAHDHIQKRYEKLKNRRKEETWAWREKITFKCEMNVKAYADVLVSPYLIASSCACSVVHWVCVSEQLYLKLARIMQKYKLSCSFRSSLLSLVCTATFRLACVDDHGRFYA
jgi:hypothetical protein